MKKIHPLIKEYIIENYPLFGPTKVAKELNMSEESICTYAKKNNLIISKIDGIGLEIPKFKYDLDFSKLFNNISNELAYWIGFFWADGTVNRHSSMVIEIIKEDGDNLKDQFLKIFPFVITERKRRNKKAQTTIRVSDKKISFLLESLGKYPNSFESHKKIMEYLGKEELQKMFLRGLIDGDGSFYWNEKEKYAQFTLASSYNQDWSFLKKFLENFNPHIVKDICSSGKSSVLRITGRDNIVNFIQFLQYDSKSIGLKRKVDIANKILKLYEENPPKELTKHVFQYNKQGEFIKEYVSAKEGGKAVGVKESAIRNCLNGLSKSSSGFIWKYNKL